KGYKLSGFTRPITRIRYNIDGDLLLVSGKEHTIFSWRGSDFEPLCSYSGHTGAINDIYIQGKLFDLTQDDSKKLISASADSSLVIWDTETCKVLHRMNEKGSFILCGISLSCEMFFYIYMPDGNSYVLNVHELEGNHTLIYKKECKGVPSCAMWGFLDEHIIIGLENGELVIFDLNSKSLKVNNAHKSKISDIQMSPDYLHFITCSQDTTVLFDFITTKLWDASTFDKISYEIGLNLNSVSLSPFKDFVHGGVDSSQVTHTKSKAMDILFIDVLTKKKFGSIISPHTGPVNSLRLSPDGNALTSGSQDSTLLSYRFDQHPTFPNLSDEYDTIFTRLGIHTGRG
ncbi:LOW QUALITY PROTEIN: hypothetical protein MXB_1731, partial [Myxobolus squamalis]